MSGDLVSVVIPSYNAASTLDETVGSARAQTHRDLDIIVVDDGSSDATAEVARRHAEEDPRVRVICQENGGVAAARNTGWMAARSDYIAFLDSDDLWHATKIERQLAALKADPDTGLVYCWYAQIDEEGAIIGHSPKVRWEGDVFERICANNFIGNGSTFMARRQAIIDADGFDCSLRAAGAQGCDDYLFACRVAENHHYAVVPEFLVGYRCVAGSVSSNMSRMLRSWLLSVEQLQARHPDKTALFAQSVENYAFWLLLEAIRRNRREQFLPLLSLVYGYRPLSVPKVLARDAHAVVYLLTQRVKRRLRRAVRKPQPAVAEQRPRRRFLIEEPH